MFIHFPELIVDDTGYEGTIMSGSSTLTKMAGGDFQDFASTVISISDGKSNKTPNGSLITKVFDNVSKFVVQSSKNPNPSRSPISS